MGTFLRVFLLAAALGGVVIGIILVGQRQLINKQAAELSSNLLNLRPTAPPTPTPGPNAGSMSFSVRFQTVETSATTKSASLSLKQGQTAVYSFRNIALTSKSGGVFSGEVKGINPAVYDVYVKGEAHLARKFADVEIKSGENTLDLTSKVLLVGDFDANNKININDIGFLSANITSPLAKVTPNNKVFDLDESGTINNLDMDILLSNYKGLEVFGE